MFNQILNITAFIPLWLEAVICQETKYCSKIPTIF